jgi:hypothetical protein
MQKRYIFVRSIRHNNKTNAMKTTETPRFEVKTKVKFGMICGYYVYDNQEKKSLAFDFDEDELYKAQSRAELSNALNK